MFCKKRVLRNLAKFTRKHLRQSLFLIKLQVLQACVHYFHQMLIFSPSDSPSKNYEKCFLFHLKSSLRSRDIQIFVFLSFRLFCLSAIALEDDRIYILKFHLYLEFTCSNFIHFFFKYRNINRSKSY